MDGLNFTIEPEEFTVFLGQTAPKVHDHEYDHRYIASTEGDVIINGHNILEEPEEAKKCIGYLPEQPPLYFDMTVLEYLKFAAELKKIPKQDREKMLEEVMDLVKISDVKDRLIKNLSKGYRQRVDWLRPFSDIRKLSFWMSLRSALIPSRLLKYVI